MKRLHTKTKIFFDNPYVLRLVYDADSIFSLGCDSKYRKSIRYLSKLITGTWGFSELTFENIRFSDLSSAPSPLIQVAYLCFRDEPDALQAKLILEEKTTHVLIWPKIVFTIYETVDDPQ